MTGNLDAVIRDVRGTVDATLFSAARLSDKHERVVRRVSIVPGRNIVFPLELWPSTLRGSDLFSVFVRHSRGRQQELGMFVRATILTEHHVFTVGRDIEAIAQRL